MEGKSATAKQDVVLAIELPAPNGWKKKFTPKKGGTPRRNDIIFISPTGEEIKSKRQLEQYIKSHSGCPPISEFDWGTGDTPRRSSRLSEKSKAVESSESETPKKKQRKSSSKKGAKGKNDASDGEGNTAKEKEAAEETKGSTEVALEDAEDIGDHDKGGVVIEEVSIDKDNVTDAEKNSAMAEGVIEEAIADNVYVDTKKKTEEYTEDAKMEEPGNVETGNDTSGAKEDGSERNSLVTPQLKENCKEEEGAADPKASSQLFLPSEAASADQEAETVKDAEKEPGGKVENNKEVEKESEVLVELPGTSDAASFEEPETLTDPNKIEEPETAKLSQNDHQNKETSVKAASGCDKNQETGKPSDNPSASCNVVS